MTYDRSNERRWARACRLEGVSFDVFTRRALEARCSAIEDLERMAKDDPSLLGAITANLPGMHEKGGEAIKKANIDTRQLSLFGHEPAQPERPSAPEPAPNGARRRRVSGAGSLETPAAASPPPRATTPQPSGRGRAGQETKRQRAVRAYAEALSEAERRSRLGRRKRV